MRRTASSQPGDVLALNEGVEHFTAMKAILKGSIESDMPVSLICGPRTDPFAEAFAEMQSESAAEVLAMHGTRLLEVSHARRGVDLAFEHVQSGHNALALVPNADLADCFAAVTRCTALVRSHVSEPRSERNDLDIGMTVGTPTPLAAMVLLLEDSPVGGEGTHGSTPPCPRWFCRHFGLPCIEPADVCELRDNIEIALHLGRCASRPVGLVVHHSILHSSQSIPVRPNRIADAGGIPLAATMATGGNRAREGRLRAIRRSETADVLRMARRLEINLLQRLPSPGEREPVGFLAVGPCRTALAHVLTVLHMTGRVPILNLALVYPIDESLLGRILTRCDQLVVLEPRPGTIEAAVRVAADRIVALDQPPARIICPEVALDAEDIAGNEPDEAAHFASDISTIVDGLVHPSILTRRILPLLHLIRPSVQVASRLAQPPPGLHHLTSRRPSRRAVAGSPAAMRLVQSMLDDVQQWLRTRSEQESVQSSQRREPLRLCIVGDERAIAPAASSFDAPSDQPKDRSTSNGASTVRVELWTRRRMLIEGVSMIRQASRDERPRVVIVCDVDDAGDVDLERFVRGAGPPGAPSSGRLNVVTASFARRSHLRDILRKCVLNSGLSVLIVQDGSPPQFSVSRLDAEAREVDRMGFEPKQRLIWSLDQTCAIRLPPDQEWLERALDRDPSLMEPQFSVDRLPAHVPVRWQFRVRPMFEQIEVVRTRPPIVSSRSRMAVRDSQHSATSATRPGVPVFVHAGQSQWRVHLAGVRGDHGGVIGRVLCDAGRAMGYHVQSIHDPTPIGAGRRGWTQILFTRSTESERRPQHGSEPPASTRQSLNSVSTLSARIPFGEADVLLGMDWAETVQAIAGDVQLRVVESGRSLGVLNIGAFSDERQGEHIREQRLAQRSYVLSMLADDGAFADDYVELCRHAFHTERLVDFVQLGEAWQRGWIPLSIEAVETAIMWAEQRGYARASEAFEFGRRRALLKPSVVSQSDSKFRQVVHRSPGVDRESSSESRDTLQRRLHLMIQRSGWGGRRKADGFRRIVERGLHLTPGLSETESGRIAQRDFVLALYRALLWGGLDEANRLADLVIELYESDRGETGRAVTRLMILPLSDAMLIRDAVYIASLARSAEMRRRVRQRLRIKHGRGDQIERRYLTRIEVLAFGRRIRADIRTSVWPARIVATFRHIVPARWRGTPGDRRLRRDMIELVQRMSRNLKNDYERWLELARSLHDRSAQNRLRSSAFDGMVAMFAEPEAPTGPPPQVS